MDLALEFLQLCYLSTHTDNRFTTTIMGYATMIHVLRHGESTCCVDERILVTLTIGILDKDRFDMFALTTRTWIHLIHSSMMAHYDFGLALYRTTSFLGAAFVPTRFVH